MEKYKILGVFTSKPQMLNGTETAIRKISQDKIILRKDQIEDDEVANTKYHGGDMRVVHHYSLKNYDHLKKTFPDIADRFTPGSFGENLLTEEPTETDLNIGDIYALGTARIQLTVSRIPCGKINLSYGDNRVLKEVVKSGHTGWFYRVLEEGIVRPGDFLEKLERPFPGLPVSKLQEFKDPSFLRKCLDTGLMDKGWKPSLEKFFNHL